jgi:hypothetical protein
MGEGIGGVVQLEEELEAEFKLTYNNKLLCRRVLLSHSSGAIRLKM